MGSLVCKTETDINIHTKTAMNNLQHLYHFLNKLRESSGYIWVEDGKLKLSTPQPFQTQENKEFLSEHKSQLISLLTKNEILSKESFTDKIILTGINSENYPLSSSQERLWFMEQFESGTNAFHIPTLYEITPDLNVEGLIWALQKVIQRHESLRSTIGQVISTGISMQKVHSDPLVIDKITLNSNDEFESELRAEINRPFNLKEEYPIRAKMFSVKSANSANPSKTWMLINKHHIASDAWSEDIFQKELTMYYTAHADNEKTFELPLPEIQYKDYALWQKLQCNEEVLSRQLAYWKNKLDGYQKLQFPADYIRPAKSDYRGDRVYYTMNRDLTSKLRSFSKESGVTLQSVMLAGFGILLSKYTGQKDIVIGTPTANRNPRQTEDVIGFFINNQINRIKIDKLQSFAQLAQQIHDDQTEAQLHQDMPFEKLVNELREETDTSQHPVFQVLFSVTNFNSSSSNAAKKNSGLLTPCDVNRLYEVEKLDFSVYVIDDGEDELKCVFSYATALFKRDTISDLSFRFSNLLGKLINAPAIPYSQINLLSDAEYDQIVYKWNSTTSVLPANKTVVSLFKEQVLSRPDHTGVVYEGTTLTYRELNDHSNALASYLLKECGLNSGDTVGIMLDRSEKIIIAILGILKAGGAYVFIDPEYPLARKEFMIKNTAPGVLITQTDHLFDVEFFKGHLFAIDIQLSSINSAINLPDNVGHDAIAYINYTSGTSGQPKGVIVEHGSLVNLVYAQTKTFNIDPGDKTLQFASFAFDASVSEIFTALCNGAELHIISGTVRQDPNLLSNYMAKHKINVATIPPVLLTRLPDQDLPFLKTLVVAGEACAADQMVKWSKGRKLINAYGPTEGTVCSTMHVYKAGDSNTNIGFAIANTSVYILDPDLNPVPVGVIGEIYIGGINVARGYLNDLPLTQERFIDNHFIKTGIGDKKGKMYKTGDLAKWLPDGTIEFIGRADDQVKINGYRIELAEVENAILGIDGIKEACVVIREKETFNSRSKYLVAYYCSEGEELSVAQFQEKLVRSLPAYMIPNAFVSLKSLPVTKNGKVDKKSLPDPGALEENKDHVAPDTTMEIQVCKIWQEILGLKMVGVTDNFFRIGGNSILAIQVSHQMSSALKFNIKVADIFKWKTIRSLLEAIETEETEIENVEKEF